MTKAYAAYLDYLGIKIHFNEPRFIWNPEREYKIGKASTFAKRNDVFKFEQIANKFKTRQQLDEYMISCFIRNRHMWVGDMLSDEYVDDHQSRLRRTTALIYTFRNECEIIEDDLIKNKSSLKHILKSIDGNIPKIVKLKTDGSVSYETLAIFDKFFNFTNQTINNLLWDEEKLKISKYKYLLTVEDQSSVKKSINQLLAHN